MDSACYVFIMPWTTTSQCFFGFYLSPHGYRLTCFSSLLISLFTKAHFVTDNCANLSQANNSSHNYHGAINLCAVLISYIYTNLTRLHKIVTA